MAVAVSAELSNETTAAVEQRSPGRRWAAWLTPAALYLVTVVVTARWTVADGYDGVGFVQALQQLDLAHFQPQPPGYPLFVALGRLVKFFGVPPAVALSVVSAILLGTGISAVTDIVWKREGRLAGIFCAALLTLAPLSYALGIATLSDGAGLGVLLLAIGVLTRGERTTYYYGGALIGVALGIRPTYVPLAALLFLGVALQGRRALVSTGLATLGTTLGWLGPFALIVGPQTLWRVCRDHVLGHFTDFGGAVTASATPGLPLGAFLRGLAESALGPVWPLGALLLLTALFVGPPRVLQPATRRLLGFLLVGLVVYGVWILIALPVRGHARHLLPEVIAVLVLFVVLIASALRTATPYLRRALQLGCMFLVIGLAATSAQAIWAFRRPTPGVALAQYVVTHYPRGTLLCGARAARFLDLHWGRGSAHPTTQFGNVIAEAERLDRLPTEVLLTSEVLGSAGAIAALRPIGQFCYDDQLPWVLRFDTYPSGCVVLSAHRFRK